MSAFDARVMDGDGTPEGGGDATRDGETVRRARQGWRSAGTQGRGGKNIKSAGSSMRRANEAALEEDMRKTFREWRDVLEVRARVFLLFLRAIRVM